MSNKRKKNRKNKKNRAKHIKVPLPDLSRDLVTDVLVRLPVKSLQRFRSVCKSWDSLIGKDAYLASQQLKHSRRQSPKKPGLLTVLASLNYSLSPPKLQLWSTYTFKYTIGDDDKVHSFDHLLDRRFVDGIPLNSTDITNSCDGLLGVYSSDRFCLVNPSIGKVQELPKGTPHIPLVRDNSVAGLGFDSLTGKYKVVRIFHREFEPVMKLLVSTGCQVLSLGDDDESRSWRLVEDPPKHISLDSSPVVVDGSMYWARHRDYSTGIVACSFDLSREKFGIVEHPEIKGTSPRKLWITQLQQCLCVAVTIDSASSCYKKSSYYMELWLLKDCTNNKWVKQYNIELMKLYKPSKFFHLVVKPVTIDNGRIMLCHGSGRRDYYDPQTKSFCHHDDQIGDYEGAHITHYAESMIWPWLG